MQCADHPWKDLMIGQPCTLKLGGACQQCSRTKSFTTRSANMLSPRISHLQCASNLQGLRSSQMRPLALTSFIIGINNDTRTSRQATARTHCSARPSHSAPPQRQQQKQCTEYARASRPCKILLGKDASASARAHRAKRYQALVYRAFKRDSAVALAYKGAWTILV